MLTVALPRRWSSRHFETLTEYQSASQRLAEDQSEKSVLMAILMACWAVAHSPAEGMALPQVRYFAGSTRPALVAPRGRRYGNPSLAPIHAPLPRPPS
jgi:hypothetical protein